MSRICLFALSVTVALLMGVLSTDAQQPKVNARGTCPSNVAELLPSSADLFKLRRQVSRPNVDMFTASDLFDKVGLKLEFGQEVIEYQASKSQPPVLFVKLQGRDICGWVRSADISSISRPMLLVDLPGTEKVKDAKGEQSKLLAKVVAMAIRKDDRLLKVPVYGAPFDINSSTPHPFAR